ncbi:vacuolar protein sorting/targeting protein 10 [Mycena alexandri]|uniref:Vacuolar protein sorting/targeting protein 10 n=1 Tax=Mycena alexandri TaxID=1745969 RepID=A0AAD6S615_9AGAR|nr:vacuolar protein sorting/targeting protein 10 [Mycena alexandri]
MYRHLCAGFLFLLFPSLLVAQYAEHTITSFQNLPAKLFFFNDTTAGIYHDSVESNIYVSSDEGKTWRIPDDIPKGAAAMVIEHPFDNSYAFVLTRTKTHYRTEDRGKTWRTFDVPAEAAFVTRPLSFHSDPQKYGHILYQGTVCDKSGWDAICHDETYYTKDAFSSTPRLLLDETSRCQFAHSSVDFKHEAHSDLVYCVAFDTKTTTGGHVLSSSRLFSSTDFFESDQKVEDLGIGKSAKGVLAFAIVSKFAIVALKDLSPGGQSDMLLYVTVDAKTWVKAQFPHASSARLRENAYTLVESTTHSLAVDIILQDEGSIGTLFVSDSNGTFFVQSLKDINRNEMGFVDYKRIYGLESISIANTVLNAEDVEGRGKPKQLRSLITFDDGSTWAPLRAPSKDSSGQRASCNTDDAETCSLHLHSVTTPQNFGGMFSSPAPGIVMGVGSIGNSLLSYEESDTFLSIDGGVTWTLLRQGAHKYEFGDSGSILAIVNDEELISDVRYSLDLGNNWSTYDFGVRLRARALLTLPDSTSQKFLLVGHVARRDQTKEIGRFVIVHLDFAPTRKNKCTQDDFEKWYARPAKNAECLMGHKQWYKRRKINVDCYVGEKSPGPVGNEDNCPCTDADYECDYNFVRDGNKCVAIAREPIPVGACKTIDQVYMGSSGWRKVPGNTCFGGNKDEKVRKPCSQAQPAPSDIIHQTFHFPSQIVQHSYFKESTTILVRLEDHSIWQSRNEGYTWDQKFPEERFLAFYHHKYSSGRAYLITNTNKFYTTTDTGRTWNPLQAPTPPNSFRAPVLRFHPESDKLIWTGNKDCDGPLARNCHAEAQYSRDNGRKWTFVENYVVNCAWGKDVKLDADPTEILCESYRNKTGSQRFFQLNNPLALIEGSSYFTKKKKMFDQIVGFGRFSEFLIVAELLPPKRSLNLQVSLDGVGFATALFPPSMHPESHAYTVLESNTGALFLHMITSEPPSPYWGSILKSNSNGTYFGLSIKNVNRDDRGFVDFEKMIGLDGIALVNVVVNPQEALVTGHKVLQSRITHDDGASWKPLDPPPKDSLGNKYKCRTTSCALHVHGYTARTDPRATYSSSSIVGVIMAVGNVGESLLPYEQSDTFLSRDAGLTWEEVHKDAHLWEFGDSGSILVMANDEEPTNRVLFSTDEGLNWREYQFSDQKMRVQTITTTPSATSRRFILHGYIPHSAVSTVVHLDFTTLTTKECVISVENPGKDDFELWSPSEERQEQCLFGRQTLYHRRVRDTNCVVGSQPKAPERIIKNCTCIATDFECEFNYTRNDAGECVLTPGTTPLPDDPDAACRADQDYWYERTPYRKISFSSCDGGERPDRGTRHHCPAPAVDTGRSTFSFLMMMFLAIFVSLVWSHRRAQGTIHLRGPENTS